MYNRACTLCVGLMWSLTRIYSHLFETCVTTYSNKIHKGLLRAAATSVYYYVAYMSRKGLRDDLFKDVLG